MSSSTKQEQHGDKHGIVTAYPNYEPAKHEQSLPGHEGKMDPLAEHVMLEKWDDDGKPYLEEYKGCGKLKGKVALITGGDSGIGRSVALMFAREGCKVTIAHLPEEEEDGEKVVNLAKEASHGENEMVHFSGDLRKEQDCKDVVQKHMDKWGKLDIIVSNASKQIPCKQFQDIDLDNVESTLRSNIWGTFAIIKFALPHLKRGSSIIMSGSVTAFKGSANKVDYATTKGALHSLTRSLAVQLAPKGIRVNSVAPGPVWTPLIPGSQASEETEEWSIGAPPLHGRPAQPAEMGPAYVFLADSGASNIMTGQSMHLNHGSYVGS